MNALTIDKMYFGDLQDLSIIEAGGLLHALVRFARHPELYTEALPEAPLSVHDLLREIVAGQG